MFENLGYSDICLVNIENWDLKNPRFSNIRVSDFFRSKFSIFAIGEYRKHRFIKVGEIKSAISAISEKSAFSIWPLVYLSQ